MHPALSIRQPWAELILSGRKSIEIRGWQTQYRGPLWLHASRAEDLQLEAQFGLSDLFKGGYIGRVSLTTIVQLDEERWVRWRERHLSPGPMPARAYGWVLTEPVRFNRPILARGQMGLFTPETDDWQAMLGEIDARTGNDHSGQ